MMNQKKLFAKYLRLLGVERSFPTYELLCQIIKAHLIKVPFENISKLIYKKRGMHYIPDLATFLEGIEIYNFGGTCYANNFYLYSLLKHLGYDIKLCGADMKNPDVHLISIVTIDGLEYIVDGGYAAPFFEPLPRELTHNFVINFGDEKYVVKPKDKFGRTVVEQYYNGKLQHWYTAKPEERKIEEFKKVINDSYSNDAVFMNAIRITRFSETGSKVLKNLSLAETVGNNCTTRIIYYNKLPTEILENFGMPLGVVTEAISSIKALKDIYG
jgi:N-hydroxyarylamine O-acetyltransferase